jgi:hypothetical protein
MYPTTLKELGEGYVIGTERVVTKASGTFKNSGSPDYTVYLYQDCLLVGTAVRTSNDDDGGGRVNGGGANGGGGGGRLVVPVELQPHVFDAGPDGAAVSLHPDQQAVIVWATPGSNVFE